MRTFIALELSDPIRKALADIQGALRRYIPGARWTKPEGTHLTLKFLGEASPDQVKSISTALDEIAVWHSLFDLNLSGVGAFPRLSNPNVIWVGIEASEPLKALQQAVEEAISPLGFPSDKRPFKGHLTLARLSGQSWSPDLRQRFLDTASHCSGIHWPIERIVLFRSELKPTGAVYSNIHSSLLKQ